MNDLVSTYKVVFSGNTLNGQSPEKVSERFAEAFKLNDLEALEQLFSGKVVTLKRGLNHRQAQRYSKVLQNLGADCCIECEYNPLFFSAEPDYEDDYERKKRRRVAQFRPIKLDSVELEPK